MPMVEANPVAGNHYACETSRGLAAVLPRQHFRDAVHVAADQMPAQLVAVFQRAFQIDLAAGAPASDGRDLQRGVFGQLTLGKATLGVYAFNPDSASRYVIVSLGVGF